MSATASFWSEASFWNGKRVLLTGHTGFKGAWLTLLLHRLGAVVCGYSLPEAVSQPCLFEAAELTKFCADRRGDIRDETRLLEVAQAFDPDVLIHMAAQPIVRVGFEKPIETFDVNVLGTAKVLEAARALSSLRAAVIVTSDKCYENRERLSPYREDEAMGGADPYSASKGAAELIASAYARTYFAAGPCSVISVRAGNVIGGGDWAQDRLIPDLVRAALNNAAVEIRNPDAVRPWQHVLDPLTGYLLAARRAYEGRTSRPIDVWNFGPNAGEEFTVREVVEAFAAEWPKPLHIAFADAEGAGRNHAESCLLRVDATKAKVELGWRPALANGPAVRAAAAWYSEWTRRQDPTSARAFTVTQMESLLGG